MTTLNQACKAIVSAAIDHEYASLEFFSEIVSPNEALKSIYQAEYGCNGFTPITCKDYLQGLPSVCTIPFANHEILEVLASYGITRKSEAAKYTLIENYWQACGNAFYNLIKG